MISIEEFKKFDLRVGKIIALEKRKVKVECGGKVFNCPSNNLLLENEEEVIILISNNNAKIVAVDNTLIQPEKNIDLGSKIE